jgi:hypothetical protein
MKILKAAISLFFILASGFPLWSALPSHAADAVQTDVLVYSNGDQLTGKLDHESGGTIYFKSDNAGTVQVKWEKLKSLHTTERFAVIENGVNLRRHDLDHVPTGPVAIDGDTLTVTTTAGARQIPVKNIAYIVDEATFEKNILRGQGLLQGITGTAAVGISTVNSTQNSQSVNTALTLVRVVPEVTWMPPRGRTLLGFNSNYGKVTQTNTPTVKTDILHGDIEQDEYFSPRFYMLQRAAFDHNFSQGLDLQQLYGAGLGYTVIKNAKQQLDLNGIVDYTRQSFAASGSLLNVPPDYKPAYSTDLVGSSFGDSYIRKFTPKIVLTEVAAMNPAWNHPSDYSANASVGLAIAAYKNLGFSIGVIDNYLNNPPVGFKGNSVQFNTGLTYAISH